MDETRIILILCLILMRETTQYEDITCTEVFSMHYGVKWLTTSNRTLSDPLCFDEDMTFLYRECTNGYWNVEPECKYIQLEAPPECPDGFIDSDSICYKVSKQKSKFPPKCPFEDVLPFDRYKNLIRNFGPVWMPVTRDLSNGIGFLLWTEANALYKSNFERDYYAWNGIKDKNCVLFYNDSYTEAVSCDEEHFSVCAYKKLNELTDRLCRETCVQSDFTANSKCFCVGGGGQNQSDFKKVEFLKPYQNNVYKRLTSDPCAIALEKLPNQTYIWTNSKQKLNYTYWSKDEIFSSDHIYGASTRDGWILTKEPVPCFLYEMERNDLVPKLELSFVNGSFRLTVTAPQALKELELGKLTYCFTNAGSFSLLYRYKVLTTITNTTDLVELSFEPHNYGPGHYWCESLRYLDLEVLKSNTIFLRQNETFQNEFIAILRVVYIKGTNPLSQSIIEFFQRVLFIKLTKFDLKNFYNVRMMQILDVDEVRNEIWVNVHFTSRKQELGDGQEKEYIQVKKQVEESLSSLEKIKIEMIDFLSADFCMNETTSFESKQLTWPKAANGTVATSEEFCIKADGTRLTRSCGGDFINGARWSPITETCEIFNYSTVTEDLITLLNKRLSVDIEALHKISKRYDEFNVLDLYLVGDILNSFDSLSQEDLDPFSEIVSNLLEINKAILLKSQLMLKATDRILDAIDQVIINYAEPIELLKENFYLNIGIVKDFSGVIFEDNNSCTAQKLSGDYDVEDVENLDAKTAVWLSPELRKQIEGNSKFIILGFFKDSFFNGKSTNVKTLSTTFRVMLPGFREPFKGPITILQKEENLKKEACSFWMYNKFLRGFWKKESDSVKSSRFLLCEFWHTTHFALTTDFNEVTGNLECLLNSSFTASEVIAKLVNISGRYNEFTYIDVYLVGQVLKKVNEDKEIDLDALAEIVSNMHKINRNILQKSQSKKRATDTILHYVDKILENHNYTSEVRANSDNFMILISDTKETNFSGLVLLDYNHTFQAEVLTGNVNIEEVVSNNTNLDSAVVLSAELKQQMSEDGKVIVTIFSNDALFNEQKQQSQYANKIFGVILPEIGRYSGPISVLQKVTTDYYQEECVHWNYNETAKLVGSWLKDQNGEDLSSFIHCEFWHTTHFALLVLDEAKYDSEILDWITTINCALSLFGLLCIILTAIIFQRWRSNSGNLILLNFVFAMMLQLGLFYVSSLINQNSDDYLLCTIIGVVLHYSIISEFCWMFVIAVLQFKRFVEVLGGPPKWILLKGCFCGWILPLIPVAAVFLWNPNNYVNGNVGLCYPSDLGLYLGVWLPVSIIVVINFVIFLFIVYSVVHRKTECGDVVNNEMMFQWRLAFLLFFMLGLTWAFGFLSELDYGEIFVYLFCATATLQGFVMFLFFIVFNVNTRYLYSQALKRCCCKNY